MLIEPVIAQQKEKSNQLKAIKLGNRRFFLHWGLMVCVWLMMYININLIYAVRKGTIIFDISDSSLKASSIFTLAFFEIIYAIGITLFLLSQMILNRSNSKYYSFFINLNSVVIIAFLIFWIFTFLMM